MTDKFAVGRIPLKETSLKVGVYAELRDKNISHYVRPRDPLAPETPS
jgi:hypothetical protein